jgi:DNA-binding transcriptional regulator YiaG
LAYYVKEISNFFGVLLHLTHHANERTLPARWEVHAMSEMMGERLQRLRKAVGLSQSQLAAAAAVPLPTLRNWEQGRRMLGLDDAVKIADVLGIPLDVLAGRDAPAQAPGVAPGLRGDKGGQPSGGKPAKRAKGKETPPRGKAK